MPLPGHSVRFTVSIASMLKFRDGYCCRKVHVQLKSSHEVGNTPLSRLFSLLKSLQGKYFANRVSSLYTGLITTPSMEKNYIFFQAKRGDPLSSILSVMARFHVQSQSILQCLQDETESKKWIEHFPQGIEGNI